jgi:hypothetical protein
MNRIPTDSPNGTEPSRVAKAMSDLMLDRQERVERAIKAIQEICQKEKVALRVGNIQLTNDGRMVPQIQLTPLE